MKTAEQTRAETIAMLEVANGSRLAKEILLFLCTSGTNEFDLFKRTQRSEMYALLKKHGIIGKKFLDFFNKVAYQKSDLTFAVLRAVQYEIISIEEVHKAIALPRRPIEGETFYGDNFKNIVLKVAEHLPQYKKIVAE